MATSPYKCKVEGQGRRWRIVLLDPLDAQILGLLRGDARLSFREIAQKTDSSVPTISARVAVLQDLGVIRGYHAKLDLASGARVHLLVHARPSQARAVAKKLAKTAGVEEVVLLSGGHIDARVRLRPPDRTMQHVHDAIAKLDGVVTYEAREALASFEPAPQDDLPSRVDVKCHQCGGPIHDAPVRKTLGQRVHVFCCRQCLGAFTDRFGKLREVT